MKETKNEQPCEPKIFTSELTEIDTNEIYIRLSNYFKSDEFINKLKAGKFSVKYKMKDLRKLV